MEGSVRMNNEIYQSLSRMMEEYYRLIKPITEQLQLQKKWESITSPILRLTEMNREILSNARIIDAELIRVCF